MKKIYTKLMLGMMVVMTSAMLSSCYTDWGGPQPPANFYDSRLTGYWQLVQINGYAVSGMEVNYMYFNGSGRGIYYYFQNNRRYWENMQYWCEDSYSYYSDYTLNILYQSSYSPTEMSYWFSNGNNALYMRWYDRGQTVTYTYTRYPSSPW